MGLGILEDRVMDHVPGTRRAHEYMHPIFTH